MSTPLPAQEQQVRPASSPRLSARVAIASSGLGHVRRGIETWAEDTARALRAAGVEATLFQGGGTAEGAGIEVLPCWRRFDPLPASRRRLFERLGGWRYGMGSPYEAEQTTFARHLWRRVRRDYDLLHVQDPWLALHLARLRRLGLSRPRVILAHGTEEDSVFLRRLPVLQHLAPCYLEEWREHRPPGQQVFAVPNFVDTGRFRPGDRAAARAEWDLPPDALVVLCVAALKRHHKRIDELIREFARFREEYRQPALLVMAGGREAETPEVVALGREVLGDAARFEEGVGRDRMPSLYRAADLFALASLHEMMPIAVLEALASGLPVACSDTPVLRWMTGEAGERGDLTREGTLAGLLRRLGRPDLRAGRAAEARLRAAALFSEPVVTGQVVRMYGEVLGRKRWPEREG